MSTNTIKGLTVEIGGDTTKLGKALEDVNKKSRDLSSELGQINKLLKLDPGNADLLAQKQKVLAEAVENTSKRLDTLKEAEKQVQEQFKRGEVSEEQVRELQREIIATESKMKSYERAAKETADEIDNLGKESKDAGDDIEEVGDESKKTAKELDDAGDKAERFGDKLKAAGALAVKVFAAVGAAVASAGVVLGKATIDAAAYADEILTQSIVTGVSTEKLQAYSYAAELVDVSIETMTKSMAKNIKSMKSATDGSKLYIEAYDKLGVAVTDANGNMRDSETVYWEAIDALGKMSNETERDALAMQLFGKSAQELNPLIEAGSDKLRELTEEAKAVGAVMSDEALEALGAYDDSLQRMKGSAGAAKNALGTVLLPEMKKLNEVATEVLTEFTTKLNESGGGLEGFCSVLSDMAGDIGTKVGVLGGEILEKLTGLLPSLGSLATGLITMLTTSLLDMLPDLVSTAMEMAERVITSLGQVAPMVVAALVTMIPGIVDALVTGLLDNIPVLLDAAFSLLNAIVDAIPMLIEMLVPMIPGIVDALATGLLDNIPLLLDAAIELFFAIIEAIPVICDELRKAAPQILEAILNVLRRLPDLLWSVLETVLIKVGVWDDEMAKDAKAAAIEFINNAIDTIKELPGKIWTWLQKTIDAVSQFGTNAASKAKSAAKHIYDAVVNGIKELPSRMLSIGVDLVRGLWDGISNMTSWITDKLSSFGENVLGGIKNFFGIESPSKVFRDEVGKMLPAGMAQGIEAGADKPLKAMADLTRDLLSEADSPNGVTLERQMHHTFAAPEHLSSAQTGMLDKLDKILTAIERGQILTLDGKALVGATADMTDSVLGQRRALAARGAV